MDTNRRFKPQGFPQPDPRGHEERDAAVGWVFGVVTFLALCVLITHFIIAGTMERYGKSKPQTDQWRVASSAQPVSSRPPFPKLQIFPPADLEKFRDHEDAQLNTYGWIDKTAGIVRIPIDRAMDLLAQRGLPYRSESNNAAAGPSTYQLIQQRTATNSQ